MANQFLALSLFVMLLSFFLILNSMSSFEDIKSSPVLNSLSLAFSNEDPPDDAEPGIEESTDASFREGDTLDRIQSLFTSQIVGADVKKNRLGTEMRIRVSLDRFDNQFMQGGAGSPGGLGADFVKTLVSLIEAQDAIPYSMDMVMNIGANPASELNERPQEAIAAVTKAAGYAQKLETTGLPRRLVTTGLGAGEGGTVDLYFRRYAPFNPVAKRAEE